MDMTSKAFAHPKPEPRKRTKGRQRRNVAKHVRGVRGKAFAATAERCVVCDWMAESLHELRPASVVGDRVLATTVENSVPVCGSGTTKCHGLLQRHIVRAVDIKNMRRFLVDVRDADTPGVRDLFVRIAQRRLATLLECT